LRSTKLTTRVGLGICQARICGRNVEDYLGQLGDRVPAGDASSDHRPIVSPVRLGDIARLADPDTPTTPCRTTAMRSRLLFSAVDSHTEGMPTRVVTGGFAPIPGETMNDKRRYVQQSLDHLRTLLMNEPRGHSAMSGSILMPPTRDDCDFGVLFIGVSGLLPMCGHGTIGTATVLVET